MITEKVVVDMDMIITEVAVKEIMATVVVMAMIKVMTTKVDMIKDMITMVVDMVAEDTPEMKLSMVQNKDWLVITMQNLDQQQLQMVILTNRLVMDQKQEVTAIMMHRLAQNQRIFNLLHRNHHHQKNPIQRILVEMVKSKYELFVVLFVCSLCIDEKSVFNHFLFSYFFCNFLCYLN